MRNTDTDSGQRKTADVLATSAPVASTKATHETLRAVIFDVDGTLAETEALGHRAAFNQAFTDFGLDWYWSDQTYGELLSIAGGKERLRHFAHRENADLARRADFPEFIARLHEHKSGLYIARVLAGGIPLRPGVARLLKELQTVGIACAIASTSTAESVRALLMALFGRQELHHFTVIGAGDIVANKKPAPDIYQWVLQELGLDATQCVVIEDSAAGLAAALAAGIPTVVTRSTYTVNQRFDGALAVLDELGEPDRPAGRPGADPVTAALLCKWHAQQRPEPLSPQQRNCPPPATPGQKETRSWTNQIVTPISG